jgi:hypothetical protein
LRKRAFGQIGEPVADADAEQRPALPIDGNSGLPVPARLALTRCDRADANVAADIGMIHDIRADDRVGPTEAGVRLAIGHAARQAHRRPLVPDDRNVRVADVARTGFDQPLNGRVVALERHRADDVTMRGEPHRTAIKIWPRQFVVREWRRAILEEPRRLHPEQVVGKTLALRVTRRVRRIGDGKLGDLGR